MAGRGIVVVFLSLLMLVSVHAGTDERALAALAGQMLDLRADIGTKDYTMACGPADEILNGGSLASPVCVLNLPDKVVFGSFGTEPEIRAFMLQAINQSPHTGLTLLRNVKESACNNAGTVTRAFEECGGAFTGTYGSFKAYAYEDTFFAGSDTESVHFVIVSDKPLQSIVGSKTFWDTIADFFARMFGW